MAKKVTLGKLFVEIELLKFILSIAGISLLVLKKTLYNLILLAEALVSYRLGGLEQQKPKG